MATLIVAREGGPEVREFLTVSKAVKVWHLVAGYSKELSHWAPKMYAYIGGYKNSHNFTLRKIAYLDLSVHNNWFHAIIRHISTFWLKK